MDAHDLKQELVGYTGGDQAYSHALNKRFFYTAGVRSFFQNAGNGAYWLSDILASEPKIRAGVERDGFCVCVLRVDQGKAMLAVARDYSEDAEEGNKLDGIHYTRAIDYTDCPDGTWKFYLTWTQVGEAVGMMAMLPREY